MSTAPNGEVSKVRLITDGVRHTAHDSATHGTTVWYHSGHRGDADDIGDEIVSADIEAVVPTKSNRRQPIPHDKAKYKWRNQIERLFNKLKNWRRVATPIRQHRILPGFVAFAAVKLWIPFVHERQRNNF